MSEAEWVYEVLSSWVATDDLMSIGPLIAGSTQACFCVLARAMVFLRPWPHVDVRFGRLNLCDDSPRGVSRLGLRIWVCHVLAFFSLNITIYIVIRRAMKALFWMRSNSSGNAPTVGWKNLLGSYGRWVAFT